MQVILGIWLTVTQCLDAGVSYTNEGFHDFLTVDAFPEIRF